MLSLEALCLGLPIVTSHARIYICVSCSAIFLDCRLQFIIWSFLAVMVRAGERMTVCHHTSTSWNEIQWCMISYMIDTRQHHRKIGRLQSKFAVISTKRPLVDLEEVSGLSQASKGY